MKLLFLFYLLILPMLLSAQTVKGNLVIIGGGDRPERVMQKIVSLAGGKKARMIIIPNASGEAEETGKRLSAEFLDMGVQSAEWIYKKNTALDSDTILAKLDQATGIFFSGGDQSYLTADLLGTKFLQKIYSLYRNGAVISGTSAGAAVMSKIMITGNELLNKDSSAAFISLQEGNIEFKEGFGFLQGYIVDQHFLKRKRHNRLISLVMEKKTAGIAIDEATAIWVKPNLDAEVIGESQVVIYDARKLRGYRVDAQKNQRGTQMLFHVLLEGDIYNLKKGIVVR